MKDATADEDGFPRDEEKNKSAHIVCQARCQAPERQRFRHEPHRKIGASITRVLAPFRRWGGAFQQAIFVS